MKVLYYHAFDDLVVSSCALIYNQGMAMQAFETTQVAESTCVNFPSQRQRGLTPSELSNEFPHQVKKAYSWWQKQQEEETPFLCRD